MSRIAASLLALAIAVACQPRPVPSGIDSGSPSPAAVPASSASAPPPSTATSDLAGPFTTDAYDSPVIDDAVDTFAAGLIDQYDGATDAGLARIFTDEGLASAMAFDWRLRGAVRNETWFRGEIAVRGLSTTREDGLARPPILDTNVGFVVEPGAELVDVATGAVLQRWSERQYYAMLVALRYDVTAAEWRATAVAPPVEWHGDPPRLPDPVRCTGLGPDLPDRADPVEGRTWCFGGAEGTRAVDAQFYLNTKVPCGETRASVLSVGWPIGSVIDDWDHTGFVRDPLGEFDARWPLSQPYLADTTLPADAYSTGLTDGEFEIFVSPGAGPTAVWARHGDRFERWPRSGPWGVTDCN